MTENIKPMLVTASQAAIMLSMSRSFFYENLSSGRIPIRPIRFGKKTLFSVRELTNYVDAGCPVNWQQKT